MRETALTGAHDGSLRDTNNYCIDSTTRNAYIVHYTLNTTILQTAALHTISVNIVWYFILQHFTNVCICNCITAHDTRSVTLHILQHRTLFSVTYFTFQSTLYNCIFWDICSLVTIITHHFITICSDYCSVGLLPSFGERDHHVIGVLISIVNGFECRDCAFDCEWQYSS